MDGMIVAKRDVVKISSQAQKLKAFMLEIQLNLIGTKTWFCVGLTFSFPFGIPREGEVEGEEKSPIKLIASYLYSHL